jgi:aminoglycoside phosphotransferase family enzyme/predicted kinase
VNRPAYIDSLLEPEAYPEPERPEHIDLAETHVSWLLFTGQFVYKVKKPVDFGFLDFSTLEQRHIYCHEEFRLNRRLSPDVYLGVEEIRERDGRYRVGGKGRVVDYAVKMLQLPRDRWLRRLLETGEADEAMVERIARRVADFHAGAESDATITRIGGTETVRYNTRENFDQVRRYLGVTITRPQYDAVRAYTEAFLDARNLLFAERAATGRIRDCHGDLHADQICVVNGIEFIDCIEFNYRFRYSDVAADVAFLAMDLDHFGRAELAASYVAAYISRSGDRQLAELLDFYKCYRAFTRGKVASFRLDDDLGAAERPEIEATARSYFELAHEYAKPAAPLLLITRGVMGSGKTALARALAPRLGAHAISSDALRKRLAGLDPGERRFEAWGEGIYSPEHSRKTYEKMHERAAELLAGGHRVILDASYREPDWRRDAVRTAQLAGARFLEVETQSPRRILEQRLVARHLPDASEATEERENAAKQGEAAATPTEEQENATQATEKEETAATPTDQENTASKAPAAGSPAAVERSSSDGRIELLDRQLAAFERAADDHRYHPGAGHAPPPRKTRAEAGDDHITVDTSGPAADTVREALARIYRACLRRRPSGPG